MPDTLKDFTVPDNSKRVKLIKLDSNKYFVEFYKARGPTGDLGYQEPNAELPKNMYLPMKLAYDLQFESKLLIFGSETFTTVDLAEQAIQSFLAEEE